MAGRSCWRLLAACSLIFVASMVVAPTLLRGQDAAADRPPVLAPNLVPNLAPQRHSAAIAPIWIPPPSLPRPSPIGRDPHAPGVNILPQLVRAAGIIFSGRVTSIGRAPSSFGQAPASTTVTFQVEHVMRGASAGHSLTYPRVGWPLDQWRALPRRRTRAAVSVCPQQVGPDQSGGRDHGQIHDGF
jgi:hypothetical protein